MKFRFWMLAAGGIVTVIVGSMLVGSMFVADPSCADAQGAERVEKLALTLIPADLVISAETMDDCDSGGPVYQEIALIGTADANNILRKIGGHPARTHMGQFAAIEKKINGTWVRYSFERRMGKVEVTIELV